MAKFDSQSPQRISNLDYNTIRDKIVSILGTGTASRGYGQPVASTTVYSGNTITKLQWDGLRYDLITAKIHQTGLAPSVVTVAGNSPIGYGAGSANYNYDTIAEQTILNRFNIEPSQSIVASKATQTLLTAWSTQAQCTLTVTFPTANDARYFFNSGGKIRFTTTRTGGTPIPQNNAWSNLLSTVGTQAFGGNTPVLVNFYNLTNAYQIFHQESSSTPYSLNYYRLEVLSNVVDNSLGTATVLTFRITLQDDYVDIYPAPPGDSVDGTLTVAISELKAVGALYPSGTFTIISPVYSISSITAS